MGNRRGSIVRLRRMRHKGSGTFLWSSLLSNGGETLITYRSGQGVACRTALRCDASTGVATSARSAVTAATGVGGYVRKRFTGPMVAMGGFFKMCVLTAKALARPFQWKEFVSFSWFLMTVSLLPTFAMSIPLTVPHHLHLQSAADRVRRRRRFRRRCGTGLGHSAGAAGDGVGRGRRRLHGHLC